jgi:hypothetical protein
MKKDERNTASTTHVPEGFSGKVIPYSSSFAHFLFLFSVRGVGNSRLKATL